MVLTDRNIFLWIAASVTAAVNPNGIKTLLASGLNKFPIKSKPVFSNNLKSLKILLIALFYATEFAGELFEKALQSLETCVLVDNTLCGKLSSSLESPPTIDKIFKVTSVPFFILGFNLVNCELDNFTFKLLYWVRKK